VAHDVGDEGSEHDPRIREPTAEVVQRKHVIAREREVARDREREGKRETGARNRAEASDTSS